jgi:hypothetical protein
MYAMAIKSRVVRHHEPWRGPLAGGCAPIALLSQRETTVRPSNFNNGWGIAPIRCREDIADQLIRAGRGGVWSAETSWCELNHHRLPAGQIDFTIHRDVPWFPHPKPTEDEFSRAALARGYSGSRWTKRTDVLSRGSRFWTPMHHQNRCCAMVAMVTTGILQLKSVIASMCLPQRPHGSPHHGLSAACTGIAVGAAHSLSRAARFAHSLSDGAQVGDAHFLVLA